MSRIELSERLVSALAQELVVGQPVLLRRHAVLLATDYSLCRRTSLHLEWCKGLAIATSCDADLVNVGGAAMYLIRRQRLSEIALVVGAPLLLAIVELFHPHPHDLLQLDVPTWLVVHYAQLPLFPLAALCCATIRTAGAWPHLKCNFDRVIASRVMLPDADFVIERREHREVTDEFSGKA